MTLRLQASNEPADAQKNPQVSTEMLPVHCHTLTSLSNATFECTTPGERFPLKTANLNSTSTTKTRTNKYTRRLRYTARTLLKLKNTKKLNYKVSKNKHTNDEDKSTLTDQQKLEKHY